jgi:membrane protein YdbS with pleckstrin-like domain
MSESSADNIPGQLRPPSVLVIPGDGHTNAPPSSSASPPACATALSLDMVDAAQECDICWASYSGWTMLPSFLVCLLLTGGIAWFGFAVTRPMAQAVILGASGIVWLVQVARWGHRCFSFNYRLTNRRLFIDRGFLFPDRLQVMLSGIDRVEVAQDKFEKWLGVGKVRLRLRDRGHETLVLAGVREPQTFVRQIEKAIQPV